MPAFIISYNLELKRELKGELSQQSWLEVKRFALDDSMGC